MATFNPYRCAVYRLYNASGDLLYVGMGKPRVRLGDHRRLKGWWPEVDPSRTRIVWYPNRREARAAEKAAIETEKPRYNVHGTPEHARRARVARARMVAEGRVAHCARPANRRPGLKIMGQAEIAERLGVTRQRVQQLIARPGWPEPYDTLAMGKVWRTEDIEAWIKEHRPQVADQEAISDPPALGRRHGARPKPPLKSPEKPERP